MVPNPAGGQDSCWFPRDLELYPGLAALLRPFSSAGIPIFLVTNQPGIAKGQFTRDDLAAVHADLAARLERDGVRFQSIEACLHSPTGLPVFDATRADKSLVRECDCRKPAPGMLRKIARDHGVDLSAAVMIGDSEADAGAAKAAGLREFHLVRSFISERVPEGARKIVSPNAPSLDVVLRTLAAGLPDAFH